MSNFDRIGILGVGNMGTALLDGLTQDGGSPFELVVYDQAEALLQQRVESYGIESAESVEDLFASTDCVVLCVKPSDVESILESLNGGHYNLISIAAGVPLSTYTEGLAPETPVVRVMPNTPAQVGEGMSFLAPSSAVGDEFLDVARSIFETVGRVRVVKESDLDAVTALSGSGPAYVFYFLEALKEAGVFNGLDADDSYEAALQTLIGSAELARQDDRSPAELREAVSSPGGTTVEALQVLDEHGVKGKIKEAVIAAYDKSKELGDR
jgi:pyrroline-5-carboxylate reductase